jgi:signal transduction histidine kinase
MDFSNSAAVETIIDHSLYFFRLWSSDKELLIYVAAAAVGLIIIVLALTCATPSDKMRIDAKLELLRDQKEKAEHLARLKAEFLNQVSHELRTPLAVIIGYVECLTDGLYGKIDDKHQEILQIVSKQSGHLKNMIDQILIYSRLEASKQPVRSEEFSPAKVLADLRETFEFLCSQKGIDLRWNVPHISLNLKNDPERFKEIASNLLQNAVKYTDRGSITVTLSQTKSIDSVVFEVSDTGVGIPPSALGNIFEPFIQAHKTSTENSRGGIGLGLSIVKRHIEQMNGTVSVVSELTKGSTFKVSFPCLLRKGRKTKNNFLGQISAKLTNRNSTRRQPPFVRLENDQVQTRQRSHQQNSI